MSGLAVLVTTSYIYIFVRKLLISWQTCNVTTESDQAIRVVDLYVLEIKYEEQASIASLCNLGKYVYVVSEQARQMFSPGTQ